MESITYTHWKELEHNPRIQPWNWYHAPKNYTIQGYSTAFLDRREGRLYAMPNEKFSDFYNRKLTWDHDSQEWMNKGANLDPCRVHGCYEEDDFPCVKLMGVSPETAERGKRYFNPDGVLEVARRASDWPSDPEETLKHVNGARAKTQHYAKSYDRERANTRSHRTERASWEDAEEDPENQWYYEGRGNSTNRHQ